MNGYFVVVVVVVCQCMSAISHSIRGLYTLETFFFIFPINARLNQTIESKYWEREKKLIKEN